MTPSDRDSLIEEARSIPWFHSINFGEFSSAGRDDPRYLQNWTVAPALSLLGNVDLVGKRCLDVGTADGLVAFVMKFAGAVRVAATDFRPRRTFHIAKELLHIDIEYIDDLPDIELPLRFEPGRFDVIVLTGLLFHVLGPLAVLVACRNALATGGIVIVETVYAGGELPALFLNTEMEQALYSGPSTFFLPTASAIEGMLKFSCFDVLASASFGAAPPEGSSGRITHIARAVLPDQVRGRRPQLINTHREGTVPHFRFDDLGKRECRWVDYHGPTGNLLLDPRVVDLSWTPIQPQQQRRRRKTD